MEHRRPWMIFECQCVADEADTISSSHGGVSDQPDAQEAGKEQQAQDEGQIKAAPGESNGGSGRRRLGNRSRGDAGVVPGIESVNSRARKRPFHELSCFPVRRILLNLPSSK